MGSLGYRQAASSEVTYDCSYYEALHGHYGAAEVLVLGSGEKSSTEEAHPEESPPLEKYAWSFTRSGTSSVWTSNSSRILQAVNHFLFASGFFSNCFI